MREVSRNKCLLKERRKILNKQPNFTPQGARKSRQSKTQSYQKERTIKDEKKKKKKNQRLKEQQKRPTKARADYLTI